MDNEKLQAAPESKNENKGFDAKDLENKSHEEQVAHLDNALLNLDIVSEDLDNALAQSEIENSGRNKVIEKSSLFDRASLKIKDVIGSDKGYDEKLSKMAKKVAEKNLTGLERGLGADVLDIKENIKTHETTTKNDLEASKDFFKPEELVAMESKLNSEKEILVADKDSKEKELQDQVKEYPAEQKYEKIGSALGEYSQIESSIKDKRSGLEADIKRHEATLGKIKTQDIKDQFQGKIETLKKQAQEMKEREKFVKERIDNLKGNQKELEPFVKRLRAVGKTKAEVIEEDKLRTQKNAENPINIHAVKESEKIVKPAGGEKLAAAVEPEVVAAKNDEKKDVKPGDNAKGGQKKPWAPKQKKKIEDSPENNEEKQESVKLQNVKKTPKQWAEALKSSSAGLLKLAEVKDVRKHFEVKFRGKDEISGLDAANFLRPLLAKKMTNANEKARMAIKRIIS